MKTFYKVDEHYKNGVSISSSEIEKETPKQYKLATSLGYNYVLRKDELEFKLIAFTKKEAVDLYVKRRKDMLEIYRDKCDELERNIRDALSIETECAQDATE